MLQLLYDEGLKQKFYSSRTSLTMEELVEMANNYIESVKNGTQIAQGYPDFAYGVSKMFMSALTFIQYRKMLADSREDIIINACLPGQVATDMNNHSKGPMTVTPEEAAITPVYLATLPPNSKEPRGEIVTKKQVVDFLALTEGVKYVKSFIDAVRGD